MRQRKSVLFSICWTLALAGLAWAAHADEAPEALPPVPQEAVADGVAYAGSEACDDLQGDFQNKGESMLVNWDGAAEAVPAQMTIPRCNCTLRGTTIPPGQLGLACASQVGGPIRQCRNLPCFTSVQTPWINGVCQ